MANGINAPTGYFDPATGTWTAPPPSSTMGGGGQVSGGMVPDPANPGQFIWQPADVQHGSTAESYLYETEGQQQLRDVTLQHQEASNQLNAVYDAAANQIVDEIINRVVSQAPDVGDTRDQIRAQYEGQRDRLFADARQNIVNYVENDQLPPGVSDLERKVFEKIKADAAPHRVTMAALEPAIRNLAADPANLPTQQPSLREQVAGMIGDEIVSPGLGEAPTIDYQWGFEGAAAPEVVEAQAAVMAEAPDVQAAQIDMSMIDPYLAQAQEARGLQMEGLDLQRQAALGLVPSAAEIQMQIGLDEATKRQMALANAARGGAGAAMRAQRMAAQQGAAMQQAGIREAALLRAQEMESARAGFGEAARGIAMTDRDMADLAQIRAIENAGNQQAANELKAKFMQDRNMTNAEFQQQMNTFNAAAQNYANVVGAQFQQQAGLAGEAATERVATQNMLTQNQRDIAELDANLRAQGMTSNQRIAYISAVFGMDQGEVSAMLQGEGMNLQRMEGEAQRDLTYQIHQDTMEAQQPTFMDYLGQTFGIAGDVISTGVTLFGDKEKSKPKTTTPTTTSPTQAPTGRTGPLTEEEFY